MKKISFALLLLISSVCIGVLSADYRLKGLNDQKIKLSISSPVHKSAFPISHHRTSKTAHQSDIAAVNHKGKVIEDGSLDKFERRRNVMGHKMESKQKP